MRQSDRADIGDRYPDKHKGGYKGQLQCGKYELTRVLSVSYGEGEYDLPKRYVKHAIRGITSPQ